MRHHSGMGEARLEQLLRPLVALAGSMKPFRSTRQGVRAGTGSHALWHTVAIVSLLVGAGRIAVTWRDLTQVVDEPWHIASGMEYLSEGKYQRGFENPPLARIAIALGPYLKGIRSFGLADPIAEGSAILYANDDYWGNLAAARCGSLPFFFLGGWVVFAWGLRYWDGPSAVCAVVLYSLLPPVLAHAGLATLDMAGTATMLLLLYRLLIWLETGNRRNALLLAFAVSFAFLVKFSSIGFFAAALVAAIVFWIRSPDGAIPAQALKQRVFQASVVAVLFVIASGLVYNWRCQPVSQYARVIPYLDRISPPGSAHRELSLWARNTTGPLSPFVMGAVGIGGGLYSVWEHNKVGHPSFLLGEYGEKGWWYYFPVLLAVKTPLPFLLVSAFAAFALMFRGRSWQIRATAAFPLAILLSVLPAQINIGSRHILIVYPLLALLAADLLMRWARSGRRILVFAAAAVVISTAFSSISSQDHLLAYFNVLAGGRPERIVSDSDLDWGQDLRRLSRRLGELKARQVSLCYNGNARLAEAGLPPVTELDAYRPVRGYVAASARCISLAPARNGAFAWLQRRQPIERIGSSIFLYKFD